MRDAGNDAADEMACFRMIGSAEAQRIQVGDGTRAHREDVAHDAADAGCRALERFDVGGVVVRFHLEDDGITVAEIDDTGIFAGTLDDLGPGRRQRLQPDAGRFVRAVLAPHHREDAEFANQRFASEDIEEALIFLRFEAVLGDGFGRDLRRGLGGHRALVKWGIYGEGISRACL